VRRLGAAVFALLVVASFAGFFVAQRLKHVPTAVQQLYTDQFFYPAGGGEPRTEAISFEIERQDLVTVEIINLAGADVATLKRRYPLAAYKTLDVAWNGRRGAHGDGRRRPLGPPAHEGEYRVRVILEHRKFETRSPTSFKLIRKGSGE
jgi:hypothetical protein